MAHYVLFELLKYQLIDISHTAETKYTKLRKIKNDLLNDKNIHQIREKFDIYEKEYPGFATKCFEKLHYYISYIQTNNIEMYLQYMDKKCIFIFLSKYRNMVHQNVSCE